jgi:hypothetical protein
MLRGLRNRHRLSANDSIRLVLYLVEQHFDIRFITGHPSFVGTESSDIAVGMDANGYSHRTHTRVGFGGRQ